MALSSCVALLTSALALDHWAQRGWLEGRWLYKQPLGLHGLFGAACVAALAWLATLLAARANRAGAALWPALRWVVPVALAAWISLWFVDEPVLNVDAHLSLGVAAAGWNVLLACAAWRRGSDWPRWARTVELVALEIASCAFAVELGLRAWRATTGNQLLATSSMDPDAFIAAHRLPPGSAHLGFPVNSEGFVDHEPGGWGPEEPWVACIGDSFSVAVVPHHRHYTTLAERELGLPVYNVGVVNTGPREYLRLIERHVLPRSPRLIVVALFLGNDLVDSERAARGAIESWIDPDEALLRVATSRLARILEQRRGGASDFGPANARDALGTPDELEHRMPWLSDPRLEPEATSLERFLYVERSRTWTCLPENIARFEALYERLLRIREAARPVPVACLLFPDEFQVEDWLWQALLDRGLEPHADRFQPQREVGAWLERNGFAYVDLLPRLRAVEPLPDGRLHVYHLHDTHFNARGNELAARALVELARLREAER